MADDKKAVDDVQYDDDGKPIVTDKKPDDESEKPVTKKEGEEKKDLEGEDDDKKPDAPDFDDDAEPVIPIRKSAAQHIIARKNEKIKKLESQVDKKGEDGADTTTDDEDDNLSEEASGAIDKRVQKIIAPLVETLVSKADEEEMKDLFSSEPEAKKYEKHIKAYLGHEQYKGVSPTVIYHHLAFNASRALGAKQKATADLEAKQSKGGGRSLALKGGTGDLPSPEDIAGMTDEEFEKMESDARQGKYIKK